MSEEKDQPAIPQKWRIETIKNNRVSFKCPNCQENYDYEASAFDRNSTETIEGMTKTDQTVSRTFGQNIIAWIVALVVYYFVHQAVNGEGTPLNYGILIPVFAAVVAYNIAKPLFSAALFSGKKFPIYQYVCKQCQGDIFLASDGKVIALPQDPPVKSDQPEADKEEETPASEEEKTEPGTAAAAEAAVDAVQARLAADGAVCWFCQKDKPADGTPHNVVLFKKEQGEQTEKTIWVPRCSDCEEVHQKQNPLFSTVLGVVVVALIVICLLVGFLGAGSMGFWAWVIGSAVAFGGFVAFFAVVQSIARRQANTAGTQMQALANTEFPEVKELKEQGWELNTTKTGNAAS